MIPKNRKHRKSNRLEGYNYSQNGYYFVTICSKDRENIFGEIEDKIMILNDIGKITEQSWLEISNHFPKIILDEFVIMPNHFHAILIIDNSIIDPVGNRHAYSLRNGQVARQYQILPVVIGSFKSAVSKLVHKKRIVFIFNGKNHFMIMLSEMRSH